MTAIMQKVSRRALLKELGLAGAAALTLPAFDRVLAFQREALKTGAQPAGVLTATEAATLAAVCARIIPTDASGPGATEARASLYIDRALGGWLAPSREDYAAGLAAVDTAARARGGTRFADLAPVEQDAVLTSLEQTPFFSLVRAHTIQGTFCDPAYGGNANFIGWDLIGYPGVRLNVTAADQRMASPPKPIRRSAYDYAMFANTMGASGAH
jgi:gluconate 2-dehydrogenase gamma chain